MPLSPWWYLLLGTGLLLSACGARDSGDGAGDMGGLIGPSPASLERTYPESPPSCAIDEMRQWVDANMRDYYLFYDRVPQVELADYTDLSQLITDLRVSPNDRFSYITDAERSAAQFEEGRKFGFGHILAVTGSTEIRVAQVYAGSPFADAGVSRGDYLLTINGSSPFTAGTAAVDDLFGRSGIPATMTFGIRGQNGDLFEFTTTSATFPVNTVQATRVFTVNNTSVGYLLFDSFLETSRAELDAAFAQFRQLGVSELILDLRYNLGGRVDVARKLAGLILAPNDNSQIFTTFALNDKYDLLNESIYFNSEANALGINRVVVLTSGDSCSASELVINGLRPFIEVITIGDTTCGKPYGSTGRQACGKEMNALQFEFVNADGAGGYYNGIAADCPASDDLDNPLGDSDEGQLAGALDYLQSGTCATSGFRRQAVSITTWRPTENPMSQLTTLR